MNDVHVLFSIHIHFFSITGTAEGLADLYPHTSTTGTSSQVTLSHIPHGTTAITTVTCWNTAGLQLTTSSNGVTVLSTPPINDSAYLIISSPFLSEYQPQNGYLPSPNVTLRWGGFVEPGGSPLAYEVCLGEEEGEEGENTTCVEMGIDRALTVDGVGGGGVANYEEEGLLVSVTAVNLAGLHSGTVRSRVYFLTEPPETTGQPYQCTYCMTTVVLPIRDIASTLVSLMLHVTAL